MKRNGRIEGEVQRNKKNGRGSVKFLQNFLILRTLNVKN
jgi:hypothetical protein